MGWLFYINVFNVAIGGALIGMATLNRSAMPLLIGAYCLTWGTLYVAGVTS